jgi:hypothetical protein
MEYNVNLKTIIINHVNLLIVIKIKFESIIKKSISERISKRASPK